ncbi:arsenosugar biosynthesis radical SAM (seleno)protein ArsS [Nevskia soli]|uniref:arsenosugar biosynthesis radical SAM (seleno)protein ArsS n=1 Tax=Nevskia soli TaxID=418856 RepID=UPI0004A72A5A|nr:arsenosugar biosynthesis radical SAM (seleno)protein ArsS [Nevskia soli]
MNKNRTIVPFDVTLAERGLAIDRMPIDVLQINVGKVCNQACHHCHVDAGPKRTEVMAAATIERLINLLEHTPGVTTVDITGGAPELNPNFRMLVRGARALGKRVIDRCNLTVLLQSGQEGTAEFLAEQGVAIVASLPCYSKGNVDSQRGRGVFDESIVALKKLNALGYGSPEGELELDLVYNPVGPSLPPPQLTLQADYKRELDEHFGVRFNRLLAITNMPISRFLHDLQRQGQYEQYMTTLLNAFNPTAARGVMCRTMLSVSWDGLLFDCDFNQMLDIPVGGHRRSIWDISRLDDLEHMPLAFGDHCYGCTAGAGSSCGGSLTR